MAEENSGEKTEKATPKRREESRNKGEVAKSRELPSVAVILSALILLYFFGFYTHTNVQSIMKESFALPMFNDLLFADFMVFAKKVMTLFVLAICPVLAGVFITALLSNIMQVGFLLSGELIKPKFSKIDPLKGFKRLFSKQSMMELLKSLLKLIIVGGIAYHVIEGEMKNVCLLGEMEPHSIYIYILNTFFKIFIKCTLAMILLVAVDYAFQRWEFEKRIKMTKQEVKDEFKRNEGDPLIKSRIKGIQMNMARKRMMQAIPEADVVITNPTHLAVAIKYDSTTMHAPKLLAKGSGIIARKIKKLAEMHGVPIVENKKVAQSLYALGEIGQEIPPDLYLAVAEVLAYIYKLKGHYAHG